MTELNNNNILDNYRNLYYYNYFRILESNEELIKRRINLVGLYDIQKLFSLNIFEINSKMNDTSIISEWTQVYKNNSLENSFEAKYQLPLPPKSVISKFTVQYKDKLLEAKIKEKSKAREQYNDTIAAGGQSTLGERSKEIGGLFSFFIGNIPPNEIITIKLTIISEVNTHLNSLHYLLHRFIFPDNSFNFKLNLDISLLSKIKNIQLILNNNINDNIPINYSSDKKNANIQINSVDGFQNSIITIVEPENSNKPEPIIEYNSNNNSFALALSFYPVFENVDNINQKSEYIFIVDCSRSMKNEPILKAKSALEICIRSLNENNKFNIYCFGSTFNSVFEYSQIYNDESLNKASSYIDNIDANLGSTNLMSPIKDILSKVTDSEYPRQIFILTDGEVDSREPLIDFVGKESNTTRIFTLGIGRADRELVIGLSNACKGYYEFIDDNNDTEDKVMKLINISNEPSISNITIDWGKLNVIQSPSLIRPLFNHERMIVYGILDTNNPSENIDTKPLEIKMIGNGPTGEKMSFSINLDFSKVYNYSTLIHTLAAFKQILDLEEDETKNSKDHKDKIIELGKKYNLASKYTSYIVKIDENNEIIQETMINTNINPRSYNQYSGIKRRKSCKTKRPDKFHNTLELASSPSSSLSQRLNSISSSSFKKNSKNNDNNNIRDELLLLLKFQKANGSFSKPTISECSFNINSQCPAELLSSNLQDIWITLLFISKISRDFKSRETQWKLAINKSIKWVKKQLQASNLLDSFDEFQHQSLCNI